MDIILKTAFANPNLPSDVYAADTFTRPDGLPGVTETGGFPWGLMLDVSDTAESWRLSIDANRLRINKPAIIGTPASRAYGVFDDGQANGIIEAQLDSSEASSGSYLVLRAADARNMVFVGFSGSSQYGLYKRINNSATALASTTVTRVIGDKIKVVMDGSNLQLFVNGAAITPITSIPDFATATKKGVGYTSTAGTTVAANGGLWDNFKHSPLV